MRKEENTVKTYVCGQGYIGAPGFGLLTPGEVLTEAHVRALGEERLNELVKSHALDVMVTRDEQPPVAPDDQKNGGENGLDSDPEAPEIDHSDGNEQDEDDEDEIPAIQLPGDLVKDADEPKPAKTTKAKTAGRGKTK